MSTSSKVSDEQIRAAVREKSAKGTLRCADAFHIAQGLQVAPHRVGNAANELEVHLSRCQLGLFGYGEPKSVVEPAEEVPSELEQAIREGLIWGACPARSPGPSQPGSVCPSCTFPTRSRNWGCASVGANWGLFRSER